MSSRLNGQGCPDFQGSESNASQPETDQASCRPLSKVIRRRPEGREESHENPTDSDFGVTGPFLVGVDGISFPQVGKQIGQTRSVRLVQLDETHRSHNFRRSVHWVHACPHGLLSIVATGWSGKPPGPRCLAGDRTNPAIPLGAILKSSGVGVLEAPSRASSQSAWIFRPFANEVSILGTFARLRWHSRDGLVVAHPSDPIAQRRWSTQKTHT